MMDSNDQTQAQAQAPAQDGTTTTAPADSNGEQEAAVTLYPTKEQAEAHKPTDAGKSHKPYKMCKAGVSQGWMWSRSYDAALAQMARKDGWTASLENTPEVTTEAAVAKLAALSDAELAALGLVRQPTTATKPTTTRGRK